MNDRPNSRSWGLLRSGRTALAVAVAVAIASASSATAAKLITGKNVKNGSLTGKDIKDRSLTARDFKGTVKGEQGPPGSAVAYAKVEMRMLEGEPTYNIVPERSKNVKAVERTGGQPIPAIPGLVCIDASVPVNVAVVSPEISPRGPSITSNVQVPTRNGNDTCPFGTDAAAYFRDSNDEPAETGFYVIFN